MIRSFRHKGLKRLYQQDDARGISSDILMKVRTVLAYLDEAHAPEDMGLPGFRLHPLKGKLQGFWSVSVSGNWRIIFRFEGGDASDVELLDYH
ncbi:MAG: type II toxin-antitoxin system RelE/ParE family toxin [Acidobacteriota bacterium]|nr:type II toxin-antitoxin system RelE/ParE family toxin [Acidobacteriota bacterium]